MAATPSLAQVAGDHLATYETLYTQADNSGSGIVGALEAASFLKKSGLNPSILSKIWTLSDPGGRGYLDKQGVFYALKFIALSQDGKGVSPTNLLLPSSPPAMALNCSPARVTLASDTDDWAIPLMERTKYGQIFESLQPVSGLLTGDKVRPVLLKSNLTMDVLGQVWTISDIDNDSMLDQDEFCVAMHLVYRALDKQPVPAVLPRGLVPPSKRRVHAASLVGATAVLPPVPMAAGELLASPCRTGMPEPPAAGGAPVWAVSAAEQVQYRDLFVKTDTDMDGFVDGGQLREIIMKSGLPQNILAHIWTLCDTQGTGALNFDQFCLAMHLVQEAALGKELPAQLTADMLPPSVRELSATAPGHSDMSGGGQKELETLSSQIDELKRTRLGLETEKAQRDADMRIHNSDVLTLQKEYDAVSSSLKQLESQKCEAQKRLDELANKRSALEKSVDELKTKCKEEETEIQNLKMSIMNQENSEKSHEEEMSRMREELASLRKEECELEERVEAGKGQMDQLAASLRTTTADVDQVKTSIRSLQEGGSGGVVTTNGNPSLPPLPSLTPTPGEQLSSRTNADSSLSAFSSASAFDDDPFKSKDPFANETTATTSTSSDPFHANDPFKNDDPFTGSDPFKGENFGEFDPFVSDPFKDSSKAAPSGFAEDPFGNDPFGSTFASARPTTAKNDPFAPSSGGTQTTSTLKPDLSDPFGTDLFAPPSPSSRKRLKSPAPPRPRSKQPGGGVPSLPPKQKKAPPPPRPPAPKPSPQLGRPAPDPFSGADPFSGGSGGGGTDSFANFTSNSQPSSQATTSEDSDLQWATESSEHAFTEQQRLAQQEEADMELAIALSKASMK